MAKKTALRRDSSGSCGRIRQDLADTVQQAHQRLDRELESKRPRVTFAARSRFERSQVAAFASALRQTADCASRQVPLKRAQAVLTFIRRTGPKLGIGDGSPRQWEAVDQAGLYPLVRALYEAERSANSGLFGQLVLPKWFAERYLSLQVNEQRLSRGAERLTRNVYRESRSEPAWKLG